MRSSATLIISFLTLNALAGKLFHGAPARSRHAGHARAVRARNNTQTPYKLQDYYHGQGFFDGFDFFTEADPTNGMVQYLNQADATSKGLAYVQPDNTTVLAVDDTTNLPPGTKRNSVRIGSKKKYNDGLIIADFFAMPHGCSVWPAYWRAGDNWPAAGEIDLCEGVHNATRNQITVHTASNSMVVDTTSASGSVFSSICESSPTANSGCGFIDSDARSYGHGLNTIGGGAFVHNVSEDGVKVWHFARDEIPADITAQQPNPDLWKKQPIASWNVASGSIRDSFSDHSLIFDITLCGDWAGATFSQFGCPGTCSDFISDASNFKHAKWMINYVAVYQS